MDFQRLSQPSTLQQISLAGWQNTNPHAYIVSSDLAGKFLYPKRVLYHI